MNSAGTSAPQACASLVEHAIAEHKAGHLDAAKQLYAAALHAYPKHPEANHNFAILLLQSGNAEAALERFRIALENDADRELYWLSFARTLMLIGRSDEALAVLRESETHIGNSDAVHSLADQVRAVAGAGATGTAAATTSLAAAQARAMAEQGDTEAAVRRLRNSLASEPANADELLLQLGDLLTESGDAQGAISAFKEALASNPDLAEAHHHLGSLLSENGQVEEGFAHLMRRAKLVHSTEAPGPHSELAHKSKHDAEQRAYLIEMGVLGPNEPLKFHIEGGVRLVGPAVNPVHAQSDLKSRWEQASPQFLVLDDFLVPQALEQLRRFCAASTVWKRVYEAGYIGATPEDGFACPLLAQIVDEISALYAPILRHHPFRYLGAFKYDSELSTGTNTHADFSAVNVNLYLAPDSASLASDRGGMVIWDLAARSEGELRYYNGHEDDLRAWLKSRGATPHRIAHRANRAVIFASSLFHRTDECSFKEGYLNKRINVSFLYGDWHSANV